MERRFVRGVEEFVVEGGRGGVDGVEEVVEEGVERVVGVDI